LVLEALSESDRKMNPVLRVLAFFWLLATALLAGFISSFPNATMWTSLLEGFVFAFSSSAALVVLFGSDDKS
jgi:hypothetical protein